MTALKTNWRTKMNFEKYTNENKDKVQKEVVDYIMKKSERNYQYTIAQVMINLFGLGLLVFSDDPVGYLPFAALILMVGVAIGAVRDL